MFEIVNMNDLIKKLLAIRRDLEKEFKSFPKECCRISSQTIKEKLGFKETFGLFIDDNKIGNCHHWNYTLSGEIIDITADQFDKNLPKVYILNEKSPDAQKHYIPEVYFMI